MAFSRSGEDFKMVCTLIGRLVGYWDRAGKRSVGLHSPLALSAAFASVRRTIAFMPEWSDNSVMAAAGRFFFEPESFPLLYVLLRGCLALGP